MSDVGPGTLIKLAYRGVAGFFVLLFLFTLGVIGGALSFAGGLVTALSWLPLAFPELLTYMVVDSKPIFIDTPELATLALFVTGIVLLAVGFLFLTLTYLLGKAAIVVDKELSHVVDKMFVSSGRDRISNLERLASLRERGILTDEEFEKEKRLLIDDQTQYSKEDMIK